MKNFIWRLFQNSGLVVLSLGLIYGGVAILRTQIPFWNLVYGLPAVFLGIVMSLISFNEIAKNRIAKSTEYHLIPCRVCHKMTLAPMLINSIVCPECQYKMAVRLQIGLLLFFILMAIPVTYRLTQESQTLWQKAHTPSASPVCETGKWQPSICQCGSWKTENGCLQGERARVCGDIYYCCRESDNFWNCQILSSPSPSSVR